MSCCRSIPDFSPHFGQRARCAVYGIGLRKDEGAHALAFDLGRSAATDVPGLMGWIRTNDEKIRTALQPAVSGTGGQYYDVACFYGEFVPIWSAEHEAGVAGGESQHFVCSGVVMMKVVDAVAPLGRPAVPQEGLFECGGRIGSARNRLTMVDENGKMIIVGYPTISGEIQDFRLLNFRLGKD